MTGAVQADEFSDLLEILPEYELVASRDDRHIAHAESEQFFAPARSFNTSIATKSMPSFSKETLSLGGSYFIQAG